MKIRFLLGPAGSGKTFRCLSEIRDALRASPEGPPLVLLAPKQATFQLERQLLAGVSLPGYTRLRILSFERLAQFVFEQLDLRAPELLAEEGRVMALRALLEKRRGELQLFRASARLPGFARQLSELLRELQQYHLTPARLESLAGRVGEKDSLGAKLRDLALITRSYADWLNRENLEDADHLLDLAAEVPGEIADSKFNAEGLWLDGFAQMTPQERRLLSAVVRRAKKTTLAFCLDGAPAQTPPWHSGWAPVTETFLRCRDELRALPGAEIEIETLPRNANRTRFQQPALRHLEERWGRAEFAACASPTAGGSEFSTQNSEPETAVRIAACANPEAEVEFAAREIRRLIRESGARFRDVAVLLRSLDGYHCAVRRIFARYEIPFFLDRREPVSHHPLAELTRCALRAAARGWEHDDWFGALKSGLVCDDDSAIDGLENEALARGWRGKSFWLGPKNCFESDGLERLRKKIVGPFRDFSESLARTNNSPDGPQLAAAFRELWNALKVPARLERWKINGQFQVHETVWEQMSGWLRNLELAFANEALPLNDWLPIIEAGLGSLSVGVVPPALDQVLVGAIDRSRNPDLQTAFVLGVNEGVFPAPPPAPALLNRAEREALASQDSPLGPDFRTQIGLERYYGYIACTRARRQVVLTFAQRDSENRELNPSPFIGDLRRLFPQIEIETVSAAADWKEAEHWSELIVPTLRAEDENGAPASELLAVAPTLEPVIQKWRQIQSSRADEKLPSELVEKIYGTELRSSVSALEDFAACPFKFFIGRGLRAGERDEFEMDPREKGSFQHAVLSGFHLRLQREGKLWRDVSPAQARALARETGEMLLPKFRDGLLLASESRRFTAEMLIEGLERLVGTLVAWTAQYHFDPAAVEISFGLPDGRLPAWRIDLDGRHALLLRGRIDRVDLWRAPGSSDALGVVMDYKSSPRQLDKTLLHHGLELQLLAYLGALAQIGKFDDAGNILRVIPAGAFFIPLKAGGGSAATRDVERRERESARKTGFQHRGRFDAGHLEKFDSHEDFKGEQFQFSKKQDGSFSARANEALPPEEFRMLVARVENFLRQHGRDIYAGKADIAPYRLKSETACDFCLYRAICRFDPWTQPYRALRPPPKDQNGPAKGHSNCKTAA